MILLFHTEVICFGGPLLPLSFYTILVEPESFPPDLISFYLKFVSQNNLVQ